MKRLLLLSVVALASCRQTGDQAAADRASGRQAVDVTDVPGAGALGSSKNDPVAKGAENVVIPANAIVPADTPSADDTRKSGTAPAPLPNSIPTQFRGRWGLTDADCTSTRGDNKGLLVIGGKDIKFYEARGALGRTLAVPSADRFEGSFDFTGEGMSWTRVERFDVRLDTLRRRTDKTPKGEPPVDLSYTRCPG
jgi:hypothetical protein